MAEAPIRYEKVAAAAARIRVELKRLGRWRDEPMPEEAFRDMGAFGSKTMTYEQWIQFVLLPNIDSIIADEADLPEESNLAVYGVRYFDGDPDAGPLVDLLNELDQVVNGTPAPVLHYTPLEHKPIIVGDTLPPVVYTLIEVLPQFKGADLESQLQTFDTFLSMLTPSVRPEMAELLKLAAAKTEDEVSRARIQKAAADILLGGRAAEPYNHEEAMRKYREEFRKGYESS
ncbi:MAG: YqcC family protein [Bacteroidetes bacterium]|nr:YqcC family protein [Bacteroidota bacterium]